MKRLDYSYWFIVSGLLYAVAAMALGLYMHLTRNMQYIPLHGHANSLGWLSLAVTGLIHRSFPSLAGSRLAALHFWVAQLGVLTLTGGLVLVYADQTRLVIYLGAILNPLAFLLLLILFARSARGSKLV